MVVEVEETAVVVEAVSMVGRELAVFRSILISLN